MTIDIPMGFSDFVGNEAAVTRLRLLVDDAKQTGLLPHIGFFGGAGNGKSTLCKIVADEIGRKYVYVNSVAIKSPMTLRGIITHPENMVKGAVVCLDECHRLPKPIQDNLLSVLEKPAVLVTSYKDQIINDKLPDQISFVLATTNQGLLNDPLLSRLQCIELGEYTTMQKQTIAVKYLNRAHGLNATHMDVESILEIGRRARSGRHVVNICDNLVRYMRVYNLSKINLEVVNNIFDILGIDGNSLTPRDRLLLGYLAKGGGAAGLKTLEGYLNIPTKDIEEKIEPWLLRKHLIIRSSSGRVITERGMAAIRGERLDV